MAEKKVVELEIESNLGNLKSQLRQAQAEVATMAEKFGVTSKEAANAAKKAAELKDAIGDAKDLTDAFNPDAKFNALTKSIGGALDGFQAVEGAMGLMGVESEKLQATLLKVQSAIALSQGLQGVMEAKDSFVQLGAVAKNALSGIRSGIAATGIGLFVVALGTIVAYWDDIKVAVNGVGDEQAKLNATAEANTKLENEKLTALNSQDNVLKLQGKSEKEILNIKIAQEEQVIRTTEAEIKQKQITADLEIKAAKRNADIMEGILKGAMEFGNLGLRLMVTPIDLVLKTANKVSEALGFGKITALNLNDEISKAIDYGSKKLTSYVFNPEETKKKADEDLKETKASIEKMKNEVAGYKLQLKQIDETASKASDDTRKDELEKQNAALEEADKLRNEAHRNELEKKQALDKQLEDLAEQNYQSTLTDQEREILATNDKYFELETLAEGNKQALAEIELAKMNELNDINVKYQTLAYEADKKAKEEKAKSDKEAAKLELENAKAVQEQKAAIQQQGLDTALQGVQLIKSLFEKSKGVQKAAVIAESAIGIAKMIIANRLANAGALATPQAIATSGAAAAPVIAMNNISTGIGIAANIAATAKALKTLGGGAAPSVGNLGGGSPSGAGGVMSPNFDIVGNSNMNQLAQLQQKPTKAYVVSGDVTSAQSLDRNRIENATLVQ